MDEKRDEQNEQELDGDLAIDDETAEEVTGGRGPNRHDVTHDVTHD